MWPLLQARSTGERGYWQVLRRSQCNRGALAWVSSPKSKKHRNRRLSFPRQWECLPTSMDFPPPQWHSGGTDSVWPTTENGLLDLRASNLGTRLCFVWKDKSYGVSHISREVPPARQLQAQESGNEKHTVACARIHTGDQSQPGSQGWTGVQQGLRQREKTEGGKKACLLS